MTILLSHCFIIVLILGSTVVSAQTNSQETIQNPVKEKTLEVQSRIKEALREKIRFTPEQIKSALESKAQKKEGFPKSEFLKSDNQKVLLGNEIVISDDDSYESEVHAAINPTDSSNIVVSPIRTTKDQFAGIICPIYYTKDFGKTWKKSSFEAKPKDTLILEVGGGDPMYAFDANGKLYFSWMNFYIKGFGFDTVYEDMSWAYSTDGGDSWKRESDGVIGKTVIISSAEKEMFDKPWMIADQTNSPYRGNLYAGIYHPSGTDLRIGLRRKEAKSVEFVQTTVRPVGDDYSFNQFTSVDVDQDGGVHLTFFADKSENKLHPALYHAVSLNGGKTLQSENKIADVQIPPYSQGQELDSIVGIETSRLNPCPHFIIDKSTKSSYKGNCYMVWTANGVTKKEANGLDIYFSRSTDNGETWGSPQIVNDDAKGVKKEQFYASISVNPNGIVCIAWYDRRNDPKNLNTDIFMSFSFDGGKTFNKNFAVSQHSTDFSTVGLLNSGFGIGDYNEILSTESYAIPFWSDARNNNGDLNLYSAFVPITYTTTMADKISSVSDDYELYDATPNPSSSVTKFGFKLVKPSKVKLEITDLTGKTLATLYEANVLEGEYFTMFDSGALPIGTYYCKLTANSGYAAKKLMISR